MQSRRTSTKTHNKVGREAGKEQEKILYLSLSAIYYAQSFMENW